jgi:outer membrane PBP1 activator LpoA protein
MSHCLRPLVVLCLASLLIACSSSPSNNLGELPGTPEAGIDQLLQQAEDSDPEEARLLRLSAADLAYQQGDFARSRDILESIQLTDLPPAQQIFASTLQAELAMQRNRPDSALGSLAHPSFQRLAELPAQQQIRSHLVRAQALQAAGQPLAAAKERIYLAPLLSGSDAANNHEAIWALVSGLPDTPPDTAGEPDLAGWLTLAAITRSPGGLAQQKSAIDSWRTANPQHPAALQLPAQLQQLMSMQSEKLDKIALLLPQQGPLAQVARSLRDGFIAGYYQTLQGSQNAPQVILYDSSNISSMSDFYATAKADGIQMVVGPLEKPLVTQLNAQQQLPITTLALNYSEGTQTGSAQLFQFGLSAEDEAREAARRAWDDGMRRAIALVPRGEWGDRVLNAFQQDWLARGGSLIAAEHVDQPVELAQQIASLFQLRDSEIRAKRLQDTLGTELQTQPARRQDVDFIFLAATLQQAQQIKPTLAFQYAGDVPVYATSHLFNGATVQSQDLNGIQFCDAPWMLDENLPMRQNVVAIWPQAGSSMGRLYAMGYDAFMLAPRLTQMQSIPGSSLPGLSGELSLDQNQRIVRQLPWAEFRDGSVQPL